MTNEEYICKAVELADGWDVTSWTDKEVGPMIRSPLMRGWQYTNDLVQGHYDALAAQLVRQAECEIGGVPHGVDVLAGGVASVVSDTGHCYGEECGPDRTMNTIKAVVESGVLE